MNRSGTAPRREREREREREGERARERARAREREHSRGEKTWRRRQPSVPCQRAVASVISKCNHGLFEIDQQDA